ncbi:TPA: hypothetical protein ENX78_07995 [Candidatus Poribacteria bacterium]|nr:hypothetical protein [Candidatus Poribacteria bacterium]
MMSEISWGKAFGYALRYILYIIVWIIIGGVIAGAGFMMMAGSVQTSTGYWGVPEVTYNAGALIGGIILIIIGWIIALLGSMASYFKIMSRLIRESTPETLQRPPPPP